MRVSDPASSIRRSAAGPGWLSLPLLLLLVGCNSHATARVPAPGLTRRPAPEKSPAQSPSKVISLTPNLTEILFALGAGDRVVGVTRNDSYPNEVKQLPRVGDIIVDWESLVRLKPDCIILDSQLNHEHLQRLRQLGLTVREFQSQSLPGMRQAVRELAADFRLEAQGNKLLEQLDLDLRQAAQQASRWPHKPSVFVEIWWEPLMTAGGQTYIDDVVEAAGGTNVCRQFSAQYPAISGEKLIELDPEIIILTTVDPAVARSRPGWSRLQAVRNNRVFRIGEDILVRPTLRMPLAVAQLQQWFAPAEAKLER